MKLRHEIFHRELDQAVETSSQERFPFVTAETLDRKGQRLTHTFGHFK